MVRGAVPIDPLDSMDPRRGAWEEFRADYAAALLLNWLLRDLEYLNPEFVWDLWNRFEGGLAYRASFEAEGSYDGAVPVHRPDGEVDFWIDYAELKSLYEWTYPHGTGGPSIDAWRSLVVVALHSGLERYARALGIGGRGRFPDRIREFLGTRDAQALDADTWDTLNDLDATRHVVVHNRGIVDEPFVRAVRNTPFQTGERRAMNEQHVNTFAACVRRTAQALKEAV